MHRPSYAKGFLLAPIVFAVAFLTVGCGGGGAEKSAIDNFFRASKLRDNVTLGNIAMASFDPRTDGQVESTKLLSVGEEKVTPLHLKELAKAHEEARAADDEFTKKKREYQDQHADELKRWDDARKKGLKLKGKDAAFATDWDKWVEDTRVSAKKVSDAREALEAERPAVELSVSNSQTPVDVTQYDGELASKDVTISADIITPNGQHVTKTLMVTMQQARLKGDKPITGRWIISKITDQTAGGKTS